MNTSKISKFENPIRISELNPKETLIRAGLNNKTVLCDIGAGTGLFSFPAAEISENTIYALEISEEMIDILQQRKLERNIKNLEIRKVESAILPIDSDICDMAILVTVLHEIEDKVSLLAEIKRLLKPNGKLAIIEFHKKVTIMGPPINHRISIANAKELCNNNGFRTIDNFELGNNFYCLVFET